MLITFTILCGLWLYTLMSYLSLNILLKYKDGERLIIYVLNTSLAFMSHDSQGATLLSVTWFTGSHHFICHMIHRESPLYLSHDSQGATPLSVTWFTGRGLADQVVNRLLTSDIKPNYSDVGFFLISTSIVKVVDLWTLDMGSCPWYLPPLLSFTRHLPMVGSSGRSVLYKFIIKN